MKKYLYGALALPLLFACSSEDFDEKEIISNDPYAGIEKVDATFSMYEGPTTRMASEWEVEVGDMFGFAWLGDGTIISQTTHPGEWGQAFQNHPLIVQMESGKGIFKPQTSIYVGDYFLYLPYDKSTVNIGPINFKSLEEQTVTQGQPGQPWKDLAKNAIIIGDKWTHVTVDGTPDPNDPNNPWDKAGIGHHFNLYAAFFSNQTGLDMKYTNNNPKFAVATTVSGARDINYEIAANENVGSADIYSGSVQLENAAKSFTYAPTEQPNAADHNGAYWADKKNLGAGEGFTFTTGAIKFNAADEENGFTTGNEGSNGWVWVNSLPQIYGTAGVATPVVTTLETSYGTVTVNTTVGDAAYALNVESGVKVWYKLGDTENVAQKKWKISDHNTFINQYGNHQGKYSFGVDFKNADMSTMHIKNDAHLQKALKFYIAAGKDDAVELKLDQDADHEFKISKISIALIQTIQAAGHVKVKACDATDHTPEKIVITQAGQTGALATATEVPDLANVFAEPTTVYLQGGTTQWTWGGGTEGVTALDIDANVKSIVNEGTLTVNAKNIQMDENAATLVNAEGATMNITKTTTVKNALTNLGTIEVGTATNPAELRAYGVAITNDATSKDAFGTINNYGAVGVTAGTTPKGQFYNYGLIDMKKTDAITLLTSNEKGTNPFRHSFADGNKMGTVKLPAGNPYAIVSVSNTAENGFIEYDWTASTYTHDPGNVKYNTINVSNNITFTGDNATEIQFIKFKGNKTQVVNPASDNKLPNLKGIIVEENKSIIIEKTNIISCSDASYLAPGATVYKGGDYVYGADPTPTSYLGPWSMDQIVIFGGI